MRYGHYEVEYGHVGEVYAGFGTSVVAGQPIAQSDEMLHIGVRFDGEEVDPTEFLTMIYNNAMSSTAMSSTLMGTSVEMDGMKVHTDYDQDIEEISSLMARYLPMYMDELCKGSYHPSQQTEQALQDVLTQGAQRNYYFESLPSISNPLGLSGRSALMVGKVQNLIISDFLNYLKSKKKVPSGSD